MKKPQTSPFPIWKQKLSLPVLSRSPNKIPSCMEKTRQWKRQTYSPRDTIEKSVRVNLHHSQCSATPTHTQAKIHVVCIWELVHVHGAILYRCFCLLAQAHDIVFQISRKPVRDFSTGSYCINIFILSHVNVHSLHLICWRETGTAQRGPEKKI